jgi:ATP-binding cassette subfamily C protein CydCD
MFRRLLSLARDSRLALAGTILCGLLTGLLIIGQALVLSRVIAGVFLGGQSLPDVTGLLRLLLIVVLLRAILAWGSEVSAKAVAVRVKSDLRRRLFDKILNLGPAYTRGERTGELVNAAVEGVEALDAYFSQYLPQLLIAALVPLSILFFVFPDDPLSGLVLLLTAPLIPVFMYLIGKSAEALTKRQWNTLSRLSAHFLDSLQGLTTLKELGRSQDYARSIDEASDRFRDVTLNVLRVTFLSALVLELVATISTAIIAVEVGLRLLYGHLAFQPALFLLVLAPEFYIPLRMLGLRFHAGMAGTTAVRRIFEILDQPLPGDQESGNREGDSCPIPLNPLLPDYLISLKNISFTYPDESQPALQHIDLEIRAGQHVALVGPTGAGKSTLAALLLRFINPTAGQITITHEPLANFLIESWRSRIAWVPQNPYLFNDTLAANLCLAKPDANDVELDNAIRAAHLDGFVRSLSDGYATVIGEAGARLSGGQAQRLALARAFLKNAPILILDESTSSLDPENEALLEESTHRLMQGRTVITIAHRLNTVFRADRIFVLDGGRLIESGTHTELMGKGGMYTGMVRARNGKVLGKEDAEERVASNELRVMMDAKQVSSGLVSRHSSTHLFSTDFPASLSPSTYAHRPPSIARLLAFLRGSWGWVALSVLLGVLTVGSNVGLMGMAAFLISAAALHPEMGALEVAIVGVRFFGISRGVFRYAERLASHGVTFRLLARLRTWFYQALEPLAPARLMQYRTGDLLARIVADIDTLENFYVRVVAPPLVATLVAAGMVYFYSRYDARLAWVYLAFTLVLGLCVPLFSWGISRRPGTELVGRRAALQARLVDGIQGLADLQAFGRGGDYANRLTAGEQIYGKIQRRLASLAGLSNGLTVLLVNGGMLAVLAFAIPLVEAGEIPGTALAVLALAALAGFEAVMPLPQTALVLSSSTQAARRLFEIVDTEPAVRDAESVIRGSIPKSKIPKPELSQLELSQLSFTYPDCPQPALREISLRLCPGRKVAIVGPSGAGKSTLANILLRFWDYSQGRILLDGCELHELLQDAVRRQFSVISQRTYFFNDTIRQNLLMASPTGSESQVRQAAQRAQIHNFIASLPKGYETLIGEQGLRLSGGERQRLAIARALLKDAPIFLLDEPTANLDPLTEWAILENLFALSRERSLLLITHRLVGLEQMDEIVVLDDGHIVERGLHAELLTRGGLYRHLWDLQNRMLVDKSDR